MDNQQIDFVILWVDPSDESWQKKKKEYQTNVSEDNRETRFRDWNNLQYLFRGIEKYTPWVNKVHFITYGHLPKWLNISNPKLNIVKHTDYIPYEYLPVFNSDPIELNLHRIKELSEKFVLFNDDTFLINKMDKEEFFKNDLPRDSAVLNVHSYNFEEMFTLAPFLNIGIINKYFNMKNVLKSNFSKWYNPMYGMGMLQNIYLLPCPKFPGMRMDHLPCSHLKSTFNKIWDIEYDLLNQTSYNRFRNQLSVNHWLMKEWNLASGNFVPRKLKIGKSFGVSPDNKEYISKFIRNQRRKMICLNDTEMDKDEFDMVKQEIINAFNSILPEKSSYEV